MTTFEGRDAVVSLRGRVDDVAAFELATVLDAAVGRQPASMVLELADLIFIGPAGLLVIANAERRLAASGVALTIRSPSVLVNHLLGMVEEARPTATPGSGHLGPEQLDGTEVVSQRFGSSLSTRDLRRVAGMPTDPDVVDGALSLVVELALTSIGDADGVSVSLLRHGVLSTVAASDQTIMAMDADQYATSEGPCVDASVKGHWFHAESLDTETRWPAFTPRARALGIKAILSSPLRAFDQPVGALNIYSRTRLDLRGQGPAGGSHLRREGLGHPLRRPHRCERPADGDPVPGGVAEPGGALPRQGDRHGAGGHRRGGVRSIPFSGTRCARGRRCEPGPRRSSCRSAGPKVSHEVTRHDR